LPVSITRLRIAGFKSFADPVSIEILPGLTGIVGPNGCGKSNVVEALRWAMGESSAKSLRGGEMDDVIFGGSGNRPSRNIAEVTLSLDETRGLAPPPFHEAADLQIGRRIERGIGSTFRINGREARARDVQTLFADLATGARASAMVSQGRVAAIVGASPAERRVLLEEAAGIAGLHARRHETELKLRAAELNLSRAEDLRTQLEGQLDGLRKQARQAARFRALADAVRAAEAELFAVQRAQAEQARNSARAQLADAGAAITTTIAAATAAVARATTAAATLPALRDAEGEMRAAVERARAARAATGAEVARAAEAARDAAVRQGQATQDLAHARARADEDAKTAERIAADTARLAADEHGHPERIVRAEARTQQAATALAVCEAAAVRATEAAAETLARHRAGTEQRKAALARAQRADAALARADADRTAAEQAAVPASRRAEAAAARDAAAASLQMARSALIEAERALGDAAATLRTARTEANNADAARARAAAAVNGLADALTADAHGSSRVVDLLVVPSGLEAAVGAALGDDLESSLDPAAPRHWVELPPLRGGAEQTLAALVEAPPALARALRAVRLADGADVAALRAGESVVSRAGDVWRWDGHVTRAGAPTRAAVRLQQRNRLATLRTELVAAETMAATTLRTREGVEAAERRAVVADRQARDATRAAETTAERTRAAETTLAQQATVADARLAAVAAQSGPARAEADSARAALAEVDAISAGLPDPAAAQAATARAREDVEAARREDTAARGSRDTLAREAAGRLHRTRTAAREREDLSLRTRDTAGRLADLEARAVEAAAAAQRTAAAPATLALREAAALEALQAADDAQRRAADARHVAETEASAADRAARAAEAAASAARERGARVEGEAAQAEHAWGTVAERIVERLGVAAALPNPPADCGAETEERARRKLNRLSREREAIGPVNQRAELEAQATEAQVDTILREGADLAHAIAKMRGSIGDMNRRGRVRLDTVFADIDRHFQALFGRMFAGGRAHLALVGSDDPLTAGLEIYAQPPGKKLATLSLLSGGEQALTALSLIFSIFRCNPAPVCVLDEVDAPLDDVNVERLCGLLTDLAHEASTRFLVITHHPHTMGRMDRLFGVTMQERGVSRLLSVDLARAAALVEVAMAAE